MTRTAHCLTAALLLTLTLTGCQTAKRPVPTSSKPPSAEEIAEQDKRQREAERMQQCQRELDAMRGMDNEKYQKFKREFDTLMGAQRSMPGFASGSTRAHRKPSMPCIVIAPAVSAQISVLP